MTSDYILRITIWTDKSNSKDERFEFLKDLANGSLFKEIKKIEAEHPAKFEAFYISDIHAGSSGVGDAYVGGGYQAVDIDDSSFIDYTISSEDYSLLTTVYKGMSNLVNTDYTAWKNGAIEAVDFFRA